MSDKTEEIRNRHKRLEDMRSSTYPDEISDSWTYFGTWAAHHDRAFLLAEDARHRAEIKRLREALGGIRIDGPDADGLVWATIQHPAIAVRSHVMVGNVNRMVSQAFLEFEQMRRKALEGKP